MPAPTVRARFAIPLRTFARRPAEAALVALAALAAFGVVVTATA